MTQIELFLDLAKEFSVTDEGTGSVSRRGLAKMCGVKYQTWKQGDSIFNKEIDKMLKEYGFSGDSITDGNNKILDTVASLVIKHYAYQGNKTAQAYDMALGAIALRTVIQKAKGWNAKDYSRYILKEPRVWSKVFGNDFYDQLSRLTGLSWDKRTHKRPCTFAKLTYELVYRYLPPDVYQTIKANQKQHGGYIHKIHQYLNQDGLNALQEHLSLTMNILIAAPTVNQAKDLIHSAVTKEYQLQLFG